MCKVALDSIPEFTTKISGDIESLFTAEHEWNFSKRSGINILTDYHDNIATGAVVSTTPFYGLNFEWSFRFYPRLVNPSKNSDETNEAKLYCCAILSKFPDLELFKVHKAVVDLEFLIPQLYIAQMYNNITFPNTQQNAFQQPIYVSQSNKNITHKFDVFKVIMKARIRQYFHTPKDLVVVNQVNQY